MRILLCEDHALMREGLELVLRELDEKVELEGVEDAETALEQVADDDLDMVLLDLGLPGMDGFEALARLRRDHPSLPVVVLSASERPEDVRRALEGGAAGFIPKSTRASVLRGALKLVLEGGIYTPPFMLDAPPAAPRPDASDLTPRQLEVLRLLARGLTNKEICGVLGIAEGTVKSHVVRIYEVLDVTNRTEAGMRVHELGLDEPEAV